MIPWLVSLLCRVVPLISGLNGLKMGVTNYLPTGMILQVTWIEYSFFFGGFWGAESRIR